MHWKKWQDLCRPKCSGCLGFQRLSSFNKALLAKHVWCLTKRPDSLVARVFKATYFPKSDVIEAKIPTNCSFIWRSLCWSRDIINKKSRWRVGNRKTVEVFEDAWVPELHGEKLLTGVWCKRKMKVEELMDDGIGWNFDYLKSILLPCEMTVVSQIDLTKRHQPDRKFWIHEENGDYSVRSGYNMVEGFFDPHVSNSGITERQWWKGFWQLEAPSKVRTFGWRVFPGLIPTDFQLSIGGRQILGSAIDHTILFCPAVRMGWKNSQFWQIIKGWKGMAFNKIMMRVWDVVDRQEYVLWLVMAWMSWNALCRAQHDEASMPNEGLYDGATTFLT